MSIGNKDKSVAMKIFDPCCGWMTRTKRTILPTGRHRRSIERYRIVTSFSPYAGLGASMKLETSWNRVLSLTFSPYFLFGPLLLSELSRAGQYATAFLRTCVIRWFAL